TASPIGETFTIIVNDTKPIWIYCGQTVGNHCQSGMVAAINAQATGNTLAAFKLLAANATLSTSPPTGPVGGDVESVAFAARSLKAASVFPVACALIAATIPDWQ